VSPALLVDARTLDSSGLGRYLREILRRVLRDGRFGRVTLLGDAAPLREFVDGCSPTCATEIRSMSARMYSPRSQLEWLAHPGRTSDVAFFPHWDVPLRPPLCPRVVTVHDLTHFVVPDAFAGWRRRVAWPVLARAVRGAETVLVVSDATRRDLAARLPDVAPRIRVVPNGVSAPFDGATAPPVPPPGIAGTRYLLAVGNRKAHKNLDAAVAVLARVRVAEPDVRLVVAGRRYDAWHDALELADSLGVRDAVIDAGTPDDATLHALYAHAAAVLVPSRYEGFGLAAVEAMAVGTPVIASHAGGLGEVAGDAAVVADPDDHDALASGALRVLQDPAFRTALVERGRRRAAAFDWDVAARATADALVEAAVGRPPIRPLRRSETRG